MFFSVIPDKNYFLAEKNGYLSVDYNELVSYMKEKTSCMTYIDIFDMLTADDYYYTDTHWRQENITDIAEFIGESMGADVKTEYKENTLAKPFYGVYYGQSALPFKADTIKYLTNKTLEKGYKYTRPTFHYTHPFKRTSAILGPKSWIKN